MNTTISSSLSDEKNLEIFRIIWLDSNTNEVRDTEQKLRSIINHLKKFQDVKQCQEYIEKTSAKDRLILIVSGQLGRKIIPTIHQFHQVLLIYIYCSDKQANQKWTEEYKKIKDVITNPDELINQITTDHQIQSKMEEPLSIIAVSADGKSTTELNGEFVFSEVLIDCLVKLKLHDEDKKELLNLYEKEYHGNSCQLDQLSKFKEDYSSEKALSWYTKESFFYKTLNTALRKQDIHMMFLLRPYISDIYHQLKRDRYQSNQILQVYRYQNISKTELDHLQESVGKFISISSFFSTSRDYKLAQFILNDKTPLINKERVLFIVNANPKIVTTKPFADISKHSEFPNESEVLFMLGSIFYLKKIYFNHDQFRTIEMNLCGDDQNQFEEVLNHMKSQNGNQNTNLRILAKILWNMGKLDLAEKYLKRLSEQLPLTDTLHYDLYNDLSDIASQVRHFDASVQWRRKALELKKSNQSINEPFQENIIHPNGMIRYGSLFGNRDGGSVFNDKIELNLSSMTYCVGVEVFWKPYLSAIRFIYESDDTSTRIVYHGNNGNQPQLSHPLLSEKFMLSTNERISKVTMYIGSGEKSGKYKFIVNEDDDKLISYIRGIRFYTTNGRRSCLYGVDDADEFSESYEGYTVGYVRGRSGLLIDTLQFVWYQQNESNEIVDDIWQEAKDGLIPSDAVVGGKEDNRCIYVIRFVTNEGKMIQGKLIEGNKFGEGLYSDDQKSFTYQVLINRDQKRQFKWITTNGKNIPVDALQASEEQGIKFYIGRFVHTSGSTLIGTFNASSGALLYRYQEQEKESIDEFEVLCVS